MTKQQATNSAETPGWLAFQRYCGRGHTMQNSKSDASIAARIINELSFWTDATRVARTVIIEPGDKEDHHVEEEEEDKALILTPPMEDCVRFLESHPLIRQMIGDLIKQEQEEKKKEIDNQETFERAVEEQHDETTATSGGDMIPRMVSISSTGSEEDSNADHDDDDDDDDNGSDISSYSAEAPLLYYSTKFAPPRGNWMHQNLELLCDETSYHDDDDDDDYNDDDDNDFPDKTLPDAPCRASPNTCICSISVHFDARYNSLIRGFTLTYTDGVEIQVGDLRLTQEVIHLTPSSQGEYFTAFQVGLKRRSGGIPAAATERIRFCTTENQWLVATCKGDLSPNEFDETVHSLAPDTVLHSIQWDSNQLCICGIELIPLNNVNRPTIPSLRYLAYNAVHSKLKQQFETSGREYKTLFQDIADQADDAVRLVYKEQWNQLQASNEAKMVPILHSAFQKAIRKRESLSKRLLAVAQEKRAEIIQEAKDKRAKIMHKWSQLVHGCLDDHRRYMSGIPEFDRRQRGGDQQQQQQQGMLLCVAMGCWNVFQMEKLALHKRCTAVPDCRTALSNCGCGIRQCETCRKPICFRHAASHEQQCRHWSRDKCGYNADKQWLVPECCQTKMLLDVEMTDSYKCSACGTQCCMDCRFCCSNCGALFCIPCFHQRGNNVSEHHCCHDPMLVPHGDEAEFEL